MTGWVYLSTDGEIAHIFPKRDDREHACDAPCWCAPKMDRDCLGRPIVVHNRSNGQQDLDTGIRKSPDHQEQPYGNHR